MIERRGFLAALCAIPALFMKTAVARNHVRFDRFDVPDGYETMVFPSTLSRQELDEIAWWNTFPKDAPIGTRIEMPEHIRRYRRTSLVEPTCAVRSKFSDGWVMCCSPREVAGPFRDGDVITYKAEWDTSTINLKHRHVYIFQCRKTGDKVEWNYDVLYDGDRPFFRNKWEWQCTSIPPYGAPYPYPLDDHARLLLYKACNRG